MIVTDFRTTECEAGTPAISTIFWCTLQDQRLSRAVLLGQTASGTPLPVKAPT